MRKELDLQDKTLERKLIKETLDRRECKEFEMALCHKSKLDVYKELKRGFGFEQCLTISIPGFLGSRNTGGGGGVRPPPKKPTLRPRRLAKRGPHSLMVEMSVQEEHINHKNRAFSYRRVLITKGI